MNKENLGDEEKDKPTSKHKQQLILREDLSGYVVQDEQKAEVVEVPCWRCRMFKKQCDFDSLRCMGPRLRAGEFGRKHQRFTTIQNLTIILVHELRMFNHFLEQLSEINTNWHWYEQSIKFTSLCSKIEDVVRIT